MVPAPVGFQCPLCVAQAQQRVPRVRTTLGGVARAEPRRATQVLVVLNVAAYVLTLLSGDRLIVEYGMFPAAVAAGEWWRLATAPFLHAGLWHVGLNMLALWVLGGLLEPLLGRGRFVAVYLVSALAGAVASYAFSSPLTISVGASGAVFGLLGATVVALRTLNRDVSGVLALLMINVVIGFVVPNIDWRAHLGGLVAGMLLTAAFVAVPRRGRTPLAWAAAAAVLAALAAVTAWRTDQLLALVAG
jgi:membrane associated rhomboid family serine protease